MGLLSVFSNIGRSKGRSALTISGIAVGIFSVAVISAVGKTGTDKINRSLDDMGINSVLVEADSAGVSLDESDVAALENVSGIDKAMPLMATVTQCELIESRLTCMAWGVSNDAEEIISLRALHGRLVDNADIAAESRVCVVDEQIAQQSYGRTNIVGKTIDINFGGHYESFEIIGVATSGLSSVQSMINDVVPYFVYLPYTTVQSICGKDSYDKIALLLDEQDEGVEIIDEITSCMTRQKGENKVAVNNLLSQKKQLDGILSTVTTALSLIAGISLVVSGISVMTAMLVSVNERKREIGIKKSLGAKNSRIVGEFLAESTALTLIGSIIGGVLANLLCALVCALIGEPFSWQPEVMALSFTVSAVIGMLSGSYPAYKAAKLKPVDALKG